MFVHTARLYSRPFALPRKVGMETEILLRVRDQPTVPVAGKVTVIYANRRNRTVYINWDAYLSGKGYMTEGLHDLLPQLFEAGIHRVAASIRPENEKSKRLAYRLGFRYEGTAVSSFNLDGRFVDIEYWALTEDDLTRRLEA